MRTCARFVGRINAAFVSDKDGEDVNLGDNIFAPAVELTTKPDILICIEMTKSGEVSFVWCREASE